MSTSRYCVVVKFAIHACKNGQDGFADRRPNLESESFHGTKYFNSGGILGDFLLQSHNRDEETSLQSQRYLLVKGDQKTTLKPMGF